MCYVLLHHKLFQKSTRLTISLQPSISSVSDRPQAARRFYLEPRQNNPSVVIRMAGHEPFDLHRTTDMQRRSVRDSAANGRMENLALYCVGDNLRFFAAILADRLDVSRVFEYVRLFSRRAFFVHIRQKAYSCAELHTLRPRL